MSRLLPGVVVLLGGCGPLPPPDYLLLETPEVLAVRRTTIAAGPHAQDLTPVPIDRVRSDALPGDMVRLEALVANEDGEVDLDRLGARWFLLHRSAAVRLSLGEVVGPCDAATPVETGTSCALGTGAAVEFVVPPLASAPTLLEQLSAYRVFVVSGWELPTAECVERFQGDVTEPVWACVIGVGRLSLGPAVRTFALAEAAGLPFAPDRAGTTPVVPIVPPEVDALPPDFAPEGRYVEVHQGKRAFLAWPGEPVKLESRQPFDLVEFGGDARDHQSYIDVSRDGRLLPQRELVLESMRATRVFSPRDVDELAADVDLVQVFVVLSDTNGSQSWSTYTFELD